MKRLAFITSLFGIGAAKVAQPAQVATPSGTYNTLTIRFNPDEKEVADRIAREFGDFAYRKEAIITFDALDGDRKLTGYSVVVVFITTPDGKVKSFKEFGAINGTLDRAQERSKWLTL